MNPLLAVVSIDSGERGASTVVEFDFPGTGQKVHFPLPDRKPLAAMRRKAGTYLAEIVRRSGDPMTSWEGVSDALSLLLSKGWALGQTLAQNDPARLLELEDAFQQAWPLWKTADWSDSATPLPLVEMRCQFETIPIELLPVFDFGGWAKLRSHDDVVRAASRFLGFGAVVKRVTSARMPVDRIIRNNPALPVQFIRHSGLGSAAAEEQALSAMDGHVQVEGPWPTHQSEEEVLEALFQALFDGVNLHDGDLGDPPVQIQHFACHCDTTAEDSDDYELILATRFGDEHRITYGQLQEGHRKRFFPERDLTRERSIILMNACGSSRTSPLTAFSFPHHFLSSGHRAFIGTETAVPDRVAAAFSAAFYGRLLERRRPLGEAVVLARRDLLRDFRNPLGILYSMYGAADLTVEHARPGIYRAVA